MDEHRARRSAAQRHEAQQLPPKAPRRDDVLLHRIFLSHREIAESFSTLNRIPVYLRHFPSSLPRRSSRLAWVRYHVENYFHELYVFQNRSEAFFKQLLRAYRKQAYALSLEERCNKLEKALKDGLAGAVTARGRHVHDRRFDDNSLRMLELIELLVEGGGRPRRDRTLFFEDAQMEKRFWMKHNNAEIKKWLDEYGLVLGGLLFMPDGRFRFPVPSRH